MGRDSDRILRELNTKHLRVETLDTVTSTNELLLMRGLSGEAEGLILTADRQTAGRGRSGRSFYSPEGTGIYTSILLRPRHLAIGQVEKLTPLAAVAVCETLEEFVSEDLRIKWVNDIYRNGRKICGILAQAAGTFTDGVPDYVVLGIGINLRIPKEDLPKAIENVAGGLWEEEDGRRRMEADPFVREAIIGRLWKRFYEMYRKPDRAEYIRSYRSRMLFLGETICAYDGADGSERTAELLDLTDDYGLVLLYEGKKQPVEVKTGEIRIRRMT